ncbi:MAG: hypothetical protein ACOYJ1_00995 [Peptococcales bacterium]|jgi:hypothetical protein
MIIHDIDALPRSINLGRQGENKIAKIQVDCATWLEQYPGATMVATFMPPKSKDVYLLPVEMEGTVMTIVVTGSMTYYVGQGSINIRMHGTDEEEKRSHNIATIVTVTHPPAEGPAPDPVQEWLEDATETLAEVKAIHPQNLSFDKSTSVLSISGSNSVELNRGLTEAQYSHLTQIMARPYGTWTLNTGPVYSQTSPSRDVPGRKSCRVEWGLGIIHLDFVAAAKSGIIGYIPNVQPNPGPKAEILIEAQLDIDAGTGINTTAWIDQGSRTIKAQGMQVGQRYLFDLIGFFVH